MAEPSVKRKMASAGLALLRQAGDIALAQQFHLTYINVNEISKIHLAIPI